MRLAIASFVTLLILSSFLFAILLTASFVYGIINWYILLVFTVVFNFVLWLLNPYIGDIVNRVFYKARFIGIDGLRKLDSELADFVIDVCKKNNIKIPKIGYIDDDNPQAFTYGSASFNARIIFTRGILKYLDTKERQAVLAHEIGHIKNKDFIIMSIASTLLQLLYELYWVFTRASDKKERNNLFIFGIISYVFYFIGTYIVLYLSRIREYYADEFSCKMLGNGNYLANALLKIAYGIMAEPDTSNEIRLMRSTRAMGIFDYKHAKNFALIYASTKKARLSLKDIEKVFLFDLLNPCLLYTSPSPRD